MSGKVNFKVLNLKKAIKQLFGKNNLLSLIIVLTSCIGNKENKILLNDYLIQEWNNKTLQVIDTNCNFNNGIVRAFRDEFIDSRDTVLNNLINIRLKYNETNIFIIEIEPHADAEFLTMVLLPCNDLLYKYYYNKHLNTLRIEHYPNNTDDYMRVKSEFTREWSKDYSCENPRSPQFLSKLSFDKGRNLELIEVIGIEWE